MALPARELYRLALKWKGQSLTGWRPPWCVTRLRLREDVAEMWRLFRMLPEPRHPRVDEAMRLVLQALGGELCGFRHDRRRIAYLLFALHNLPRAYLPEGEPMRTTPEAALEYSRDWLLKANIHPK